MVSRRKRDHLKAVTIPTPPERPRILILGGGFAGVYTFQHLQKMLKPSDAEIVLISDDNFLLMTPLLFEAGSGVLEFRHAMVPLRSFQSHGRFYTARVLSIDPQNNTATVRTMADDVYTLTYDHLVLGLGVKTNRKIIPGSEHAIGFKTIYDSLKFRESILTMLEIAESELRLQDKRETLQVSIIGGGLVGVELAGELIEMIKEILHKYPSLKDVEPTINLIQRGPRILPEMADALSKYATAHLERHGVTVYTGSGVKKIEEDAVVLDSGMRLPSKLTILAAGNEANPVFADCDIEKGKNGRVLVDQYLSVIGQEDVWALGDCALIPDGEGGFYPPLAQHAIREAKVAAINITRTLTGRKKLKPFDHKSKGTLATLGHYQGIAQLPFANIKGFFAWWLWRTYYLYAMPTWSHRVRLVIDWTLEMFFTLNTSKIELEDPEERK